MRHDHGTGNGIRIATLVKNLSQAKAFLLSLGCAVKCDNQGGILGTLFDAKDEIYALRDVTEVQIQRHINRRGNTFQLHLALPGGCGLTISTLSIVRKGSDILVVRHDTAYGVPCFILGVSVFGLVATLLLVFAVPQSKWLSAIGFFSLIGLTIGTYQVFNWRSLSLEINRAAGVLHYRRDGVLGRSLDEQDETHPIHDLRTIQIRRHYRRYGDTFQLELKQRSGDVLSISAANLGFGESEEKAEQIHAFLGLSARIGRVG